MTVFRHHWDIDYDQFNKVIKDLKKIIRDNSKAGKMTFVYFHYGGHGFVDDEGNTHALCNIEVPNDEPDQR